jgi:hypothetical protein
MHVYIDLNCYISSIHSLVYTFITGAPAAQDFTRKLKPCCRSYDPNGYCGQGDDDGKRQCSVCHNPDNHFYWDDAHPSESGWDAVIGQLQAEIQDFL